MDERFADYGSATGLDDEAGLWFVRLLEPNCPDEVRAEFDRWRAASPAHAAAYREIVYLWRQSEDAVKDSGIMAAADRALYPLRAEPQLLHRWFYPVATALTFSAVLALVVIMRWQAAPADPQGTHYATVAGQQRTLHLNDGSSIVLDTGTELVERYSEKTRRIDLLHGQAQFQVQGNPARPFVVHAQSGTVTAVGTEFQVRIYGDETAVTLLKGKLAIANRPLDGAPQFASLTAGEQLAFDPSGRIGPVHPADVQMTEGWIEGKLFVHDWRLPELLAEMNRYSATQLQIGDPSLQDIRISGAFHTGDQTSLIEALQQGWPIRADHVSAERVVLVRRR